MTLNEGCQKNMLRIKKTLDFLVDNDYIVNMVNKNFIVKWRKDEN